MSEVESTPAAPVSSGFGGLPRWLRIGIVAAATAVVVLIIAVVVRIALQAPNIPLGETPAADLQPGACLLEPGAGADRYTVVACGSPHQQQVIAQIDIAYPGVEYFSQEALDIYAGYSCDRLLEYRLFLIDDLVKSDHVMTALTTPTLDQYEGGDAMTLCAIGDNPDLPEKGGIADDLTADLYQPIPQ
ncbi:MAG TPA: hypothetical protein VNR36_09270 [Pseudolysinimonas sp.]|nr:hypothetical protein [Pseudolysinimonas sp.]